MPTFCLKPTSQTFQNAFHSFQNLTLRAVLSICVCETDLQFSIFLQSQTTYWVQMPIGGGGNLHADVSEVQNNNTRAPPATNYRNWNCTLARKGQVQNPPHLLWPIKTLLLFLLSTLTCFLKFSKDVVYREFYQAVKCFGGDNSFCPLLPEFGFNKCLWHKWN